MKNTILLLFVLISTVSFSQSKDETKKLIEQYDEWVKKLAPIDSTLKAMYIVDAKKDSVFVVTQKKLEQPCQYSVKKGNKSYSAVKEMYEEEQRWVVNPPSQEGFMRWLETKRKETEVKK